jgi:hypothetical protein
MLEAALLDDLMERVDAGGLTLSGEGGFFPETNKAVLERGLATELTEIWATNAAPRPGGGSPNWRNGWAKRCTVARLSRQAWPGDRRTGGLVDDVLSHDPAPNVWSAHSAKLIQPKSGWPPCSAAMSTW